MQQAWRRHRGTLGLVVLGLLFLGPALAPSAVLMRRDALRLYLPYRAFFASEVSQGRLPTWFPYDGVGQSFIGGAIGGALDPTQLLTIPLGPAQGLKWQMILWQLVAVVGAARLARKLGASPPGRALSGLGYGLSGYLLSVTDNPPYLEGAALLPWAALAAECWRERPDARTSAALALFWAFGLWVGDIQGLYLMGIVSVCVGLTRRSAPPSPKGEGKPSKTVASVGSPSPLGEGGLRNEGRVGLRAGPAAAFLIALLLWVLLAAPVLGPILATFLGSSRAGGLAVERAQSWSMHPLRLLELVVGQPYPHHVLTEPGWGLADRYLGGFGDQLWAGSVFAGTALVACALLALRRGRPQARRYGLLGLLGLLLALGAHTPVWGLFFRVVPVFHAFRYPEKWLPLALLGLAMCAGLGVPARRRSLTRHFAPPSMNPQDEVGEGSTDGRAGAPPRPRFLWERGPGGEGALAVGAAALLGAALLWPVISTGLLGWFDGKPGAPLDDELLALVGSAGRERLLLGAAVLLGMALAARWRRFGVWVPVGLQWVQAVIVCGGWAHAAAPQPDWPRSPFLAPIEARLQGAPGRFCWEVDQFHLAASAKAEDWAGMQAEQLSLAPEFQTLAGLTSATPYVVGMDAELLALCPATRACQWPCPAVLGSRFGVMGLAEWDREKSHLTELARLDAPLVLLAELPTVRQWIDVVGLHHEPTPAAARDALALGRVDVVHDVVAVGDGADVPRASGSVTEIRRPRPDELTATVSLDAPGVIAISEACSARGWSVTLDGVEAPIERVNLGLCAVRAPAGKHALRARYTPPGWPWAFLPYALGLLWVALALRAPSRTRSAPPDSQSAP